MRHGGLYLFSGLLNEVTQVVLLNTFPISIMNHPLLIIPVQPRWGEGGELLLFRVCGCQSRVYARVILCAKSAQSAERRIDTARVTDREQVV